MFSACKFLTKLLLCLTCAAIKFGIISGVKCNPAMPLGMESKEITDEQITASSRDIIEGSIHPAIKARIRGMGSWVSNKTDEAPWIQVDLGSKKIVTGFIVQGYKNLWVSKMIVKTGIESDKLTTVTDESGVPMVFQPGANFDDIEREITRMFVPILPKVQYFQIEPKSCRKLPHSATEAVDTMNCALRFEILGCIEETPLITAKPPVNTVKPTVAVPAPTPAPGDEGLTPSTLALILTPVCGVIVALIGLVGICIKKRDDGMWWACRITAGSKN